MCRQPFDRLCITLRPNKLNKFIFYVTCQTAATFLAALYIVLHLYTFQGHKFSNGTDDQKNMDCAMKKTSI